MESPETTNRECSTNGSSPCAGTVAPPICTSEPRRKFASRIRHWKIVLWDTPLKARIRIDGVLRKSSSSPETELLVIDLPNRDSTIDISIVGGA